MDAINLIIDNKSISVSSGNTVLEAAVSNGIYIPTLCSHPNLPPAALELSVTNVFQGSKKINNTQDCKSARRCGLCIVEIEGKRDLISSCVAQVKPNMVVITDSKKVKAQRKKNLIPFLSRHRHACLTCAQQEGCSQTQCSSNVPENERCCSNFNNCEFRKLVSFIGISNNIPKWIPSSRPVIENQPLFKIDYNLCIGCTRCVRVCNKIRGVGAIGFLWDIKDTLQIGTINETLKKSDCKFCTACVEVCPTSARTDKNINITNKEKDLVPCKSKCPVHINIPEYLRMISKNKFTDAYEIIIDKVPFPAVLGRICMHPCEDACRRKKLNNSISICALKKFTSDINKNYKYKKKNYSPDLYTGKKISVIGAGPTGLTASFYLQRKGHQVTLYDENDKAGGMLKYGIPNYRLPPQILDNEIKSILSTGINFKPNTKLGTDFNLDYLKDIGSDAILIAIGAQKDRKINIDGSNLKGISGGINFLRKFAKNNNIKISPNVVVIGGGNVAADVAMTAIRCRTTKVSIVCLETEEEMPANAWEIGALKSEGIKILPSWAPKKIIGKKGNVIGIDLIKCSCVFDSKGNFNPTYDYKTKKTIPADEIIIAIGQETDINFLDSTNISTKNGFIVVDENTFETTCPTIYSGGDVTYMPGSVIKSIASGKKLAQTIDKALGGTGIIDEFFIKKSTKNNFLGKDKNFAKWTREIENELDPKKRCYNFDEILLGFNKNQAIREAKRCLQCDLRLNLKSNVSPPQNFMPLTAENLDTFIPTEIEGVYKLFDINQTVISIRGTNTLRHDLINELENTLATFFAFEEDKMYSKRESELIQKHLQEYGEMPVGDNEMDDLF